MVGASCAFCIGLRGDDRRILGEPSVKILRGLTTFGDHLLDPLDLLAKPQGLNLRGGVVPGREVRTIQGLNRRDVVKPVRNLPRKVQSKESGPGELLPFPEICNEKASFTQAGDVFNLMEAEAPEVPNRPEGFVSVVPAEAMGGVFDHRDSVLARKAHDRGHIRRITTDVDGNDSLGLFGDLSGHVLRVYVDGCGVDVGEDNLGADRKRIRDRCHEGDARSDDLVARSEVCKFECDFEPGGCVGQEAGMLAIEELCSLFFQALDLVSQGEFPCPTAGLSQFRNGRFNLPKPSVLFRDGFLWLGQEEFNHSTHISRVDVFSHRVPGNSLCTG